MHAEVVVDDPRTDPSERAFALASPEAAVVVATALAEPVGGCGHGMAWFLRRLGVHMLARLTDRPDRAIADCLSDTIAETAALHGARCDLSHEATPAASMVACRTLDNHFQYLVLGPGLLTLRHTQSPTTRTTGPLSAAGARPAVAARARTGATPIPTLAIATLTADATNTPAATITLTF
ncbi:hypothetical protein [Streptomyces sp. SID3343]|uniref:hypothetical protein n=1 Tax=Streptomyces sp. SID3343 TaxID=2690260 RepID=UPI0013693468|nr:hypothetical protein [Streptomyces sp. SID3343]MYV97662.1 hypothetical protein [Streptomyces sp. SID3343]